MAETRKLAAILAADVAGYSKLAGADEERTPFTGGAQTATLRYVEGVQAAGTGDGGRIMVEGAPVSLGREPRVTEAGAYRLFAGWRSDPFFFDPDGGE